MTLSYAVETPCTIIRLLPLRFHHAKPNLSFRCGWLSTFTSLHALFLDSAIERHELPVCSKTLLVASNNDNWQKNDPITLCCAQYNAVILANSRLEMKSVPLLHTFLLLIFCRIKPIKWFPKIIPSFTCRKFYTFFKLCRCYLISYPIHLLSQNTLI